MEEDIKSFLDYLASERKYSPNTLAAYHSDLLQLASHIKPETSGGDIGAGKLDIEILSSYMHSLQERKYALSTVARKVAAAKSFLKYMVQKGKWKGDQKPDLASPQVNRPTRELLSVSEIRRFLAEPAKISTTEAKRDKAMLELLYATGLRASELMALNVDDIDLKKNNVRCRGRGSRVRTVPIDQHIAKIVREYLLEVRPKLLNNEIEVAVFLNRRGERLTRQGFWQIIQGYAEKADLGSRVTPRSLRHSFAAHKLQSGADLQSVQELLGHAHIATTKAYEKAI